MKRKSSVVDRRKGLKKIKFGEPLSQDLSTKSQYGDTVRIIEAMIAKIASAPSDRARAELEPFRDYLQGLSNRDVQTIAFVLKTLDRFQARSYLDYIYFLLHPISSPRKCRPPGMMTNPLGTEIRCVKGYNAMTTSAGQETLLFVWTPQRYRLNTASPFSANTDEEITTAYTAAGRAGDAANAITLKAGEHEYSTFWIGTEAKTKLKEFGPGAPAGYQNFFKSGRLIAAELQITVIQSQETNQGRFVISPVYDSGSTKNNIPDFPTEFLPTTLDAIFDNKIVYENHVSEGVRAVYFPVHTQNFDFHDIATPGYTLTHNQRMVYQGSVRAIPVGSRVEVRTAMYFELTVSEQSYEIISDPSENQGDIVTGSIQNVMDGLQIYAQDMGAMVNLRKEEVLRMNTKQLQHAGINYINQYAGSMNPAA